MRPPLGARLCRTSSRLPRSAAGGSPQFCSYDVEQPRCCISCHKHRRACLLLLQLRRVPQTACLCHTSCICNPTCMLYRKLQMILLDIFFPNAARHLGVRSKKNIKLLTCCRPSAAGLDGRPRALPLARRVRVPGLPEPLRQAGARPVLRHGGAGDIPFPQPFPMYPCMLHNGALLECTSPLKRGRSFGEFVPASCGGV